MEKKINESIKCSVQQCAYNNGGAYCSLDKISVGTHEANPTQCQCVDCQSFVLGNDNCKNGQCR